MLEDLGLTKGEIKVYLGLSEIGTTKVGHIIEKCNMASSAVHNVLISLIYQGLVAYTKKENIKYYSAVPAKELLNFIDAKKKKLLEILPYIELKQKLSEEKQDAEIFEGVRGVTSMLNIIIEDGKRGDEFLFFSSIAIENEELQRFFEIYNLKRQRKGILIKGIAPKELKKIFSKQKVLKVKYPKFPIPSDMSIFKDKIALISWGEKPVGYLIQSKQIVNNYRELFNRIWSLS